MTLDVLELERGQRGHPKGPTSLCGILLWLKCEVHRAQSFEGANLNCDGATANL